MRDMMKGKRDKLKAKREKRDRREHKLIQLLDETLNYKDRDNMKAVELYFRERKLLQTEEGHLFLQYLRDKIAFRLDSNASFADYKNMLE